jgi:hypothetical protein
MSEKSKAKANDPEQSKRFIETAEKVGADDAGALEQAFGKIIRSRPSRPSPAPKDVRASLKDRQ